MSQLDFADFFNQAEDPAPAPVVLNPSASVHDPSPAHRMMSIETARKQFVSVFRHTAGPAPAPLGRVQRLHYAYGQ